MGNCLSRQSSSSPQRSENDDTQTVNLRNETPPMPDTSINKIKEGLRMSPKRQKTSGGYVSLGDDEINEQEFLSKREESRREMERLEKELEEKFRKADESARIIELESDLITDKPNQNQQQIQQEQQRIEQERIQQEKIRKEKERIEQEKIQQEKLRIEQEKIQQEKIRQEKIEQEKIRQEKIEQEKIQQEKLRIEQEKIEQEKIRQEKERIEQEKLRQEQIEEESKKEEVVTPQQEQAQTTQDISSDTYDTHQEPTEALKIFSNFPKEIYRIFLNFLPREERFKVRLLSKFWRDLVDKSGTVLFILNEVTRNLSIPNVIIDDRSLDAMTEDGLREFLGKNTTIAHVLFRGSNWSPSKAARVLINNATIVEDAAFRVSAHCATEEFQDLEVIRKRNLAFVPCREALEKSSDYQVVMDDLVSKYGPGILHVFLSFAAIMGMEDLVEFLLKQNVDPFSNPPEFKDSPLILALRKNESKVIQKMEEHFGGPLIGWCGQTIDRESVEKMLRGKPPGTFITRYSARPKSYVISHNLPSNIEHMSQIVPKEGGKIEVTNKQDGTVTYESFPSYVYRMILRDGMYCLYPLRSTEKFEPILPPL